MRIWKYVSCAARTLSSLGALGVLACGAGSSPVAESSAKAGGPDNPFAAAEEAALTPLATGCTFVAATGLMTVTVGTNETAIVSLRAADKTILANGVACAVPATQASLKKLQVNGTAGANTLILDYTNGLFATGTSSAASGTAVALGGGGDNFGIKGTSGADTFTFGATAILTNTDANKDITVTGAIAKYTVSLGDGDDTWSASGAAAAPGAFTGGVTVYGGAGNDTFNEGTVSTPSEIISGGAGNDTVTYASRTNPIIVTLGATADDGETGETDNISDADVVYGGTVADSLTAAAGVGVTFFGGAGDDTLVGDSGNDTLNGDLGNDILRGKAGNDVLNGGDGDDTFDEETASNGGDTFNGGLGVDVVDYSSRTAILTVTMDGTTADDGESGELDNVKGDVENVKGGSANDTITGNALNNVIWGNGGNDTIHGGAGDDTFPTSTAVADGDDHFYGDSGVDTVSYAGRTGAVTATLIDSGAPGASGVSGESDLIESDVESLWGGAGDDVLTGNSAANELVGGAGNDTLAGGAGDDTLEGGAPGNTETNALDCGAGDGDVGLYQGSGTKVNCEF